MSAMSARGSGRSGGRLTAQAASTSCDDDVSHHWEHARSTTDRAECHAAAMDPKAKRRGGDAKGLWCFGTDTNYREQLQSMYMGT